jgi:hypothetical protein
VPTKSVRFAGPSVVVPSASSSSTSLLTANAVPEYSIEKDSNHSIVVDLEGHHQKKQQQRRRRGSSYSFFRFWRYLKLTSTTTITNNTTSTIMEGLPPAATSQPPQIPDLPNLDTDSTNGDAENDDEIILRSTSTTASLVSSFFTGLSHDLWMSFDLLFNNKLNWLLLLGPVALLGDAMGFLGEAACFAFSGIALIPCAERYVSYLAFCVCVCVCVFVCLFPLGGVHFDSH